MYDRTHLPMSLERMAKLVKRSVGSELLLFYLTKSGYSQSEMIESALQSQGICLAPFLLTEAEPEIIGENGYKVYRGILEPSKNGNYRSIDPIEIRKLGISIGLGWDDIANLYRHVVGSTLYLAENKRSLGLQKYILALHKDVNEKPLAHLSINPYSNGINFGNSSDLLLKINELAPKKYKKLRKRLEGMIYCGFLDPKGGIGDILVPTNVNSLLDELHEVVRI